MKSCEFLIQSTLFNRKRLLRISPDGLSFEDRGIHDLPTVFPVSDIEAFRYGISRISGWHFIIGRTYFLDIRGTGKRTIRIRLRSLYGVRREKLGEKYVQILNRLTETYFNEVAVHYTRLLRQGMSFELSGVPVSPEGIWVTALKREIPWSRMAIHRYVSYFSISDPDFPDRCKILHYGHDWNAAILLGISENEMRLHNMAKS